MKRNEGLVTQLARATMRLVDRGNLNPSAEDIAREHYGPKRALGGGAKADVRKRLPQIKNDLNRATEHIFNLLGHSYYVAYLDSPPQTEEQARKCIPGGRGNRAEGLHIATGPDDLILKVSIEQDAGSGFGKGGKAITKADHARRSGHLTDDDFNKLLERAQTAAQPIPAIGGNHETEMPELPEPDN